jgi:hypothetical protein
MPILPFRTWLERRLQEVPDTSTLALVIARSGAAGVSREGLEKTVRISAETLESLLRAMVAAGQVTMLRMHGQLVYRATG